MIDIHDVQHLLSTHLLWWSFGIGFFVLVIGVVRPFRRGPQPPKPAEGRTGTVKATAERRRPR